MLAAAPCIRQPTGPPRPGMRYKQRWRAGGTQKALEPAPGLLPGARDRSWCKVPVRCLLQMQYRWIVPSAGPQPACPPGGSRAAARRHACVERPLAAAWNPLQRSRIVLGSSPGQGRLPGPRPTLALRSPSGCSGLGAARHHERRCRAHQRAAAPHSEPLPASAAAAAARRRRDPQLRVAWQQAWTVPQLATVSTAVAPAVRPACDAHLDPGAASCSHVCAPPTAGPHPQRVCAGSR